MIELILIHGFLGTPFEWNQLRLKESKTTISLFSPKNQNIPLDSLESAGEKINEIARMRSSPRLLIGYSLGGRIALHALEKDPNLWSGAIFISTHPGLTPDEEKSRLERMKTDQAWSKRFLAEDWEQVLHDWNNQPVLLGKKGEPYRNEEDFSRPLLAKSLDCLSLSKQKDQRQMLKRVALPILWIVGEQDSKFKDLGQTVAQLGSHIEVKVIKDSSHRILFDQPEKLSEAIHEFIARLR